MDRSGVELHPVGPVGMERRRVAAEARRFTDSIIVQTLVSGGPTAVLLMRGQAISTGTVFWTVVAALTLRLVLLGRDRESIALIIALLFSTCFGSVRSST